MKIIFKAPKYICVLLLIISCTSYAEESFDAIINLGGDCQVAYQLYMHGLRKYALPFDTLITPCETVQAMLENSFEDFMQCDNFELVSDENGKKYILDKKYGARLLHDFRLEDDFLKDHETIATKYLRRITRLFDVIEQSEYPLFIRKNITKDQSIELQKTLVLLREERSFLLIVLDDTEEIRHDWQLKMVRNYYLQQPDPYVWRGDSKAWKEIFIALGLETSNAQNSSDEH